MFGSDQPLISNQLPISFDLPDDQEQWKNEMELMVKRINTVVNTKEGGLYVPQEVATFKLYFTLNDANKFRNTYRKTFDMVDLNGGNINPGTTVSFAHSIGTIIAPTDIFGTATTSAPIKYIPLPYVSAVEAEEIQIYATSSNIVLVNGTLTLTQCYITIEWLKN